MKRPPKLMSLPQMRDILHPHADEVSRHLHIDARLAVLLSSAGVMDHIMRQQPPFTFDDRRLGIVVRGHARIEFNLIVRDVCAGMLVYIGPGSVVSPLSLSADFEICGIGVPADFALPGPLPPAFNGQVRDFVLPASASDVAVARRIVETLWLVVGHEGYHQPTVGSLVLAQMHHYDALFRRFAHRQQGAQSRAQTVFDRFIQLVNQHVRRERHVAFYADQLCLGEGYLGVVVRRASGVTPKEWIDRAILSQIKVELRHTEKTNAQIADDLNFPNPSFFNKYFKRMTGMTPAEFRNS